MIDNPNQPRKLWLLAIVLLFVIPSCAALDPRFNWIDDAYYIVVAKALATGQGYTNINLPTPTFHSHFPPGLPVLLSLPMLAGLPLGTTIVICKVLLIALGALGLWGLARLMSIEEYPAGLLPWGLVISAVSVAFVSYTCRVASEMLYFPLSVLALVAVHNYRRTALRSWWLPAAILLLAALVLTRSIGALLVAAIVLDLAWKRDFKRLLLLAVPVGIMLMAWSLGTSGRTPGAGDYTKEFVYMYRSSRATSVVPVISGIAGNVWALINIEIPRTIFSIAASEVVQRHRLLNLMVLPLRLAVSALALWPIVRGRGGFGLAIRIYLALYFVLMAVWPSDPSRYLVPVGPFFCFSFVEGVGNLLDGVKSHGGWSFTISPRTVAYLVIGLCIASNVISDARYVVTVRRTGDFSPQAAELWDDCMDAYKWIDQNTSPSAVIGCVPPIEAHVYLFTDRKSVPLPARVAAWKEPGTSYILQVNDATFYGSVDSRVETRVVNALTSGAARPMLTEVYRNRNAIIYEVGQPPPGLPSDIQVARPEN
ncbi:MAG TPA: hypothetical protein VI756_31345 [Blastocatellia bacterium]